MSEKPTPKIIKNYIITNVKNLDNNDFIDICKLIKLQTTDYSMVIVKKKGTFINLDKLDIEILTELYSMISTKLQRIINNN
jgi:roadblock/LC7 domain-containing protein